MKFTVHSMLVRHPEHGTFWLYLDDDGQVTSVARCYGAPGGVQHEQLKPSASHAISLDDAEALIARRIRLLDGEWPEGFDGNGSPVGEEP